MDLWIRSQDKECLMKIDRVDYGLSCGEHRIMVNGYETLVGKYKTKERALEVLDEIQNKMGSYLSEFNDSGITLKEVSTVVYEMPEV